MPKEKSPESTSCKSVLLVGTGLIAGGLDFDAPAEAVRTHARAFHRPPQSEIVGIVNPDLSSAGEFCRRLDLRVPIHSSLDEARSLGPIDLVVIASPTKFHVEQLREALKLSPRAVLCEKPLANSSVGLEALLAEYRQASVLLAVNYHRRWDVGVRRLLTRTQSGEYGAFRGGKVYYSKGIIHNASHALNLIQAFAGERASCVYRALSPWGTHGDHAGDFIVQWDKDARVSFHYCRDDRFSVFEVDLLFEKGRILFADNEGEVCLFQVLPSELPDRRPVLKIAQRTPSTLPTAFKEMASNVIAALSGTEKLVMESRTALETLRLCEKILQEG